jgi:putative membrane protein
MKRLTSIEAAVFLFFSITVSAIVTSCSNNNPQPKTEDSTQVADKQNDAKFDNKKQKNDADFLVDAAAISLEEIKLGKLAQQKGSIADVRELGKMMIEAHTKILRQDSDLAKTKQVTLPDSVSAEAADNYNQLKDKTGNDFNKAYCDRMVSGHKDAIAKFEKEAADSRDQDIKEWAATTLPELRKHLDKVFACQKKCEKP